MNPFIGTFEDCPAMMLKKGARCKVPRVGSPLDFGLRNFQLVGHLAFNKSGQKDSTLVQQTDHSDHRRQVEDGRFSVDGLKLKQNHYMWHTIQQWKDATMVAVRPPARTELAPISFLGAFLPDTSIILTPKGGGKLRSHDIDLGCFACFHGQEIHAGSRYTRPHRRLHAYANVADLRFLPISRAESLWILAAACDRTGTYTFDASYMDVLKMRALESLDVYEFGPHQGDDADDGSNE